MKNIKLLLLLFTVIIFSKLSAQTYRIDTANISFQNKLRPCLQVNYDADPKTVKKAWSNFLKKNYKLKTKGIETERVDKTPWGIFAWMKDADGNGICLHQK